MRKQKTSDDDFIYAFPAPENLTVEEWEAMMDSNEKRGRFVRRWVCRLQGFVAGILFAGACVILFNLLI